MLEKELLTIFTIMEWGKSNRILVSIVTVVLLLLVSSCEKMIFEDEVPKLLGVHDLKIISGYTAASIPSTYGEGYGIEIYEIDSNGIQTFLNLTNRVLPDKRNTKEVWEKYNWRNGPFDSTYVEVLNLSLSYYNRDKGLAAIQQDVRDKLLSSDVYFSFYYLPDEMNPRVVQFFLLDTRDNKFYCIEHSI